jgi:hypothetical protein
VCAEVDHRPVDGVREEEAGRVEARAADEADEQDDDERAFDGGRRVEDARRAQEDGERAGEGHGNDSSLSDKSLLDSRFDRRDG